MTFCVPAAVKHQHIVKGSKFPLQTLPAASYNGLPSGLHNMVHLKSGYCHKPHISCEKTRVCLIQTFHLQIPTILLPPPTSALRPLTPPRCLQGLAPLEHSVPLTRRPGSSHRHPNTRPAPPLHHHHQLHQ